MGKIGLSMYALHLSGRKAEDLELHNIVNNKSLIAIMDEFIEENKEYVTDEKEENVFRCEHMESGIIQDDEGNEIFSYISGIIKTGEYGDESEIIDIKSGETTHVKRPDEANVMPFGFCIAIPAMGLHGATVGLALLQTKGGLGIKKVLEYRVKAYIQKLNKSTIFYLGNLCPRAYINRFLSDQYLKKIRLIRYNISNDEADGIGINNGVKQTYEELRICRPTGFIKKKSSTIQEYLNGKRAYTSIIELPNFPYDDLKFEFKMNNTVKTMSMKNLSSIAVTEDITKKVKTEKGNPTRDSLLEIFKMTARQYLEEMGLIEKLE